MTKPGISPPPFIFVGRNKIGKEGNIPNIKTKEIKFVSDNLSRIC
jgi:hypothetical protein